MKENLNPPCVAGQEIATSNFRQSVNARSPDGEQDKTDSFIITDNLLAARCKFPGQTIISDVSTVFDLPDGTLVKLYQDSVGASSCPVLSAARALIGRGIFQEVGE